jgi:hypothetical protein
MDSLKSDIKICSEIRKGKYRVIEELVLLMYFIDINMAVMLNFTVKITTVSFNIISVCYFYYKHC